MPEPTCKDATLPSVIANLAPQYRPDALLLSVVFHPDTELIGARFALPQQPGAAPFLVGRLQPIFDSVATGRQAALDEPHVSRQALSLQRVSAGWVLRAIPGSSPCRVNGKPLQDAVQLDCDELAAGVSLQLGHSVVLLLRSQPGGDRRATAETGTLRGSSLYMQRLRAQVAQVAATDLDVLIRGETGTGKELVATAIHAASGRAASPLVAINMAAIPESLATAALFGAARGSYTGATRPAPGYFQQAQGGSLFLDEVGDTPATIQPQLLRALQQREIQSVGGPVQQVDVRVLSATDAALEGDDCGFKAALRHRLGACEIVLLPLRAHPEDIGELLLYFLQQACAEQHRAMLLPSLDSPAMAIAQWAELFRLCLTYQCRVSRFA